MEKRAAESFQTVEVELPAGKFLVRLRQMDAETGEIFSVSAETGAVKIGELRARLAAHSIVDENNERIFVGEDGFKSLMRWPSIDLKTIYEKCIELNQFHAKAVEDASKNSEPTTGEEESSDSPERSEEPQPSSSDQPAEQS